MFVVYIALGVFAGFCLIRLAFYDIPRWHYSWRAGRRWDAAMKSRYDLAIKQGWDGRDSFGDEPTWCLLGLEQWEEKQRRQARLRPSA